MSRYQHSSPRILKVYTEALMRFSHMSSPYRLNHALLETVTIVEMVKDTYIPKTGEKVKSL